MANKKISARDQAELRRMRNKVDSVRGHGVLSTPNGIALPPRPKIHTAASFESGWWGIIQQTGPEAAEDYADARYWVARADMSNDAEDPDDATIEFDKLGDGEALAQIVTATNLAEYTSGGHVVPFGQPVWVEPMYDGKTGISRFMFSYGEPLMYQKITGATKVSGVINHWAYNWIQVIYMRNGQYQEVPGGFTQSHAKYGGLLYNSMEQGNTGGLEGNGVNMSLSPQGQMYPLGVGAVVRARRVGSCDVPSVPQWEFAGENAVIVKCP